MTSLRSPAAGANDALGPHDRLALRLARSPLADRMRGVRTRAARWRNAGRILAEVDGSGRLLIPSPVFVLSSVRSGSTLLRSILDSHSAICAPHELHLATMRVTTAKPYAEKSWNELGMSLQDLENMLWDRGLHRELVRSGKQIIVDKTPQNAGQWRRISAHWPDARYLHLRRHPGSVFASLTTSRPGASEAENIQTVTDYGQHLDEARGALPGPTIRYEDLTDTPEATVREVCQYLGVRYEPSMLKYKKSNLSAGLGDWSSNIRSGRIQPHGRLPEPGDLPEPLQELATRWGY